LEWLIRAQKPGRPFGTEPTMSMWTMSMTGITCSTDNILESQSQSTSRCSQQAVRAKKLSSRKGDLLVVFQIVGGVNSFY
jgi:hypothetical protein